MLAAPLLLLGLVASAQAPDDPAALIERLGASRYADREAAADAIERLGRTALPGLRAAAKRSADPEVRSRAEALTARIEAAVMVRPTLVRLDFRDRPIGEVVKALAERSGVPMALVPENNPIWNSRRISLLEPEPATFWAMLDRLGKAAGVQPMIGPGATPMARGPVVQLYAGGNPPELPTSDSGPFRVTIHGAHYHRDLTFGAPNLPGQAFAVQGNLNGQVRGGSPPGGRTSAEQFYLDLQVAAEPRMGVVQSGQLKLVEAIDDKDNSLLPPANPSTETIQRAAGYVGAYGGGGMATFQMQVHLRHPDDSARAIKRLRGTLPVSVSARRDEPLTISLAEAKGKTFTTAEASITIHDVRTEADQPRSSIDLTIQTNNAGDPAAHRFGAELMSFRGPNMPQSQLEILDAQGRSHPQWFPSQSRIEADSARMTLTLLTNEQVGPPAQLRFYEMARAATEVSFEFRDLPMP